MSAKLPSDLKPADVLNVNVGVLGHVDSGKTSLVKALSTLLSTASLDKNPQSIARGITLDLGFSAFLLPLPERLESQCIARAEAEPAAAVSTASAASTSGGGAKGGGGGDAADGVAAMPAVAYRALQFTLVDCPGHAGLIRTIIGGAQIIDMMILVVNVLKGIQTQTAECLVIGEICTRHLIVVLNKVDLIPKHERAERIALAAKGVRAALKSTKFANCPIVACAAAVGGEKVAAATKHKGAREAAVDVSVAEADAALATATDEKVAASNGLVGSIGLEDLLETITDTVVLPARQGTGPFYFSIDHWFPIKGQGTVVTGTVLSGTVKVRKRVNNSNCSTGDVVVS